MRSCLTISLFFWLSACTPEPDRGKCLKPVTVHFREEAGNKYTCEWEYIVFGESTGFHYTCRTRYIPLKEWDEERCELWEFPNGKAEK